MATGRVTCLNSVRPWRHQSGGITDAQLTRATGASFTLATGKTLTAQIEKEFDAADRLLAKGLDELSQKFQKSAPTFYEDYWNARAVVDTAATRDTEEGEQSGPQAKAA